VDRCDQDEDDGRDAVYDHRQNVLQAVQTLQVVGQEDREQRDHDDPLARSEVPAVDGRAEEAYRQRPGSVGVRAAVLGQARERRGPIATSTSATPIRTGTIAANAPGKARSSRAPWLRRLQQRR